MRHASREWWGFLFMAIGIGMMGFGLFTYLHP